MRLLLVIIGSFFLLVFGAAGSTDFSGTWVLDLRSSSAPEPILKRLGASWVERTLGASLQLESTYTQTPHSLTVHLRGPAFNRTDVMRIDNQPERFKKLPTSRLLGRLASPCPAPVPGRLARPCPVPAPGRLARPCPAPGLVEGRLMSERLARPDEGS
jgi:hypothetical protein